MAVTKQGFPVYWKVLSGQVRDSKTVTDAVSELKKRFPDKQPCIVMDKSMVNQNNIKKIEENNLSYLCTIPKTSLRKLDCFPKSLLLSLSQNMQGEMKKEKPDYQKIMRDFPYFLYHSKTTYYHLLEEKDIRYRYV